MTVHGAKGLEAPIVILADTTTPPEGPAQPRLLDVAVRQRGARHAGPHRLGRAGRPTTSRRSRPRAQRAVASGRERIPPAALRGDDARRRPAGRLRRGGENRTPGRLLVRADRERARSRMSTRRPPTTATAVLRYRKIGARRDRTPPKRRRASCAAHRVPDWLGATSPARGRCAVTPASAAAGDRRARSRRGERRARCARHAGAPADAIAARRSGRAPRRGRAALSRARARISPRPSATTIVAQVLAVLDDPRFAPLFARQPRRGADRRQFVTGGRTACPARSTAWR